MKNELTREMICEIPDMYDIGKRPLSTLLGWSDVTLTRYMDGRSEPSKNYIDTLLRLYNEPDYYMLILERNKGLISDLAYKKSKKVTQQILESKMKDNEYLKKVVSNVTAEFVSQLNGFNFSTKCVQGIMDNLNAVIENSINNNKVQIEM